jgi:hypothetical protein
MSGYYSKKVAAPTPKGIIFLCKILGSPLLGPPSYLCEEKVNKRLSWSWRNGETMVKADVRWKK